MLFFYQLTFSSLPAQSTNKEFSVIFLIISENYALIENEIGRKRKER